MLLPAALNDTRTAPLLDAFPLLSMILALPALRLFWRTHRHADLVSTLFSFSSHGSWTPMLPASELPPRALPSQFNPLAYRNSQGPGMPAQVIFGGGFLLASFYHYCHLSGLAFSQLFGITGHRWRSLDVTFANFCLGRTFGHALGARHPVSVGTSHCGSLPSRCTALLRP